MTSEERPKIIDNPNRRSLKVWSERLGRYYYKSKDPEYYNRYFHAHTGPRTCDICGKVVTCQLYSHKKSQKCQAKKRELEMEAMQQQLDALKTEEEPLDNMD